MNVNKILTASVMAILIMASFAVVCSPSTSEDTDAAVPPGYIPVNNAADLHRIGTGQSSGGYTWSMSASYYQTANINLTGTNNHTAIGTTSAPFTGKYDGAGFYISGMNIKATASGDYSLFGRVVDGQIQYVNLTNVSITSEGSFSGGYYAGIVSMLTGYSASVEGCTVGGFITPAYSVWSSVGGIAAHVTDSRVTNCVNNAIVKGLNVGGIAGSASPTATISDCTNRADITGGANNATSLYTPAVGGIVGLMTGAPYDANKGILRCTNTGNIKGLESTDTTIYSMAGGIVGFTGAPVTDCLNTGNVSASTHCNVFSQAGGIVGRAVTTIVVKNCLNVGNITASSDVAGRAAYGAIIGGSQTATNSTTVAPTPVTSYYSETATLIGSTIGANGTKLTTAQLKSGSSFVGWNFTTVWKMDANHPVLRVKEVTISSSPVLTVVSGQTWTYTPSIAVSGYVLEVSGASWLSASGPTVAGTAPTVTGSQDFVVTVKASLAGYITGQQTFTITVSAEQTYTELPVAAATATKSAWWTYDFNASTSQRYTTISWDFGDGATSNALNVSHMYRASGAYTYTMTATNNIGNDVFTGTIIVSDDVPSYTAAYGRPYTYTLEIETNGNVPTVSGAAWLSVTDYGPNHVTVSGTSSSTSHVGKTYNIVLTIGEETVKWPVTVSTGSEWPVPGFTVTSNGLTVKITSTATNADYTFYRFMADGSYVQTGPTTQYTYTAAGTYIITQLVRSNVDGQTVTEEFSRTITVSIGNNSSSGDDDSTDGSNTLMVAGLVLLGIFCLALVAFTGIIYFGAGTVLFWILAIVEWAVGL